MNVFDASTTPSFSPTAEVGHQIPRDHPDTTESLGYAISEAMESAVQSGGAKRYVLGSVFSQVLLHQSIIGLESKLAMEQLGKHPGVVMGYAGGGSNLGGPIAPFMANKLRGIRNSHIMAVEPASCPFLTRGKYTHNFCDTSRVIPLARVYTLGCGLAPSADHAGGLCYYGMSPILSKLYHNGYIKVVAYEQTRASEVAVLFTKRETILLAPEPTHAIRGAIDEVLRYRESRKVKTILLGLTGTRYPDMTTYEGYLSGEMSDSTHADADLRKGSDSLPKIPQNEGI